MKAEDLICGNIVTIKEPDSELTNYFVNNKTETYTTFTDGVVTKKILNKNIPSYDMYLWQNAKRSRISNLFYRFKKFLKR